MRYTRRPIPFILLATVAALGSSPAISSAYAACKKCPASAFHPAAPAAVPHTAWEPGGGWLTSAPLTVAPGSGFWPPGDYEARVGSPYYYSAAPYGRAYFEHWSAAAMAADPYTYHFGPGFHRHSDHGHYRFPYYSYRRPWYFPGPASWNRDTNFAW